MALDAMPMRPLETYELRKLFTKQGLDADQVESLLDVAKSNDGRLEVSINPARGDLARGHERAEEVFATTEQIEEIHAEMHASI